MNYENIESLWRWFYQNQNKIIQCFEGNSDEEETIVNELNQLVLSLGKYGWEIGKGIDKDWMFVLSPNEDKELLNTGREIIAEAPQLPNWEFHPAKPPKPWDRKFVTYDDNLQAHSIDANLWSYVSFIDDDNKIDLLFEIGDHPELDDDTKYKASEFVALSELGEEGLMFKIGSIDYRAILSTEDQEYKRSVNDLKTHILG